MTHIKKIPLLITIALSSVVLAQAEESMQPSSPQMKKHSYPMMASDCSEMEVFEPTMSMCMPFPMKDMPMTMLMLTGNAFVTGSSLNGPRGKSQIASPNMFMLDAGKTLGDRHYINLDLMGTIERWTFPANGYPELLQIGEVDSQGNPYLDAQHPHSSPIMGLTLSDTIRLGNKKDHVKFFIAPRGAATDGPIAFMHRPTGIVNPDAPLGHHIGQDIGHISSTVIGGSLALGGTRFQLSAFNGTEPEPSKVDLPIHMPNSGAFRIIQEISPKIIGMGSVAYIKDPEGENENSPGEIKAEHQWRLSASIYTENEVFSDWALSNAVIFGHITDYDHAAQLSSVAHELWLRRDSSRIWSRIEFVQRTARQLQITSIADKDDPKWVAALTLGYTHALLHFDELEMAAGASLTKDFLPTEFTETYGGHPWSARIFVQIRGMKMWEL